MKGKLRIGALISGGGSNLQAIIDSVLSGEIDGEMVFVGTDNPGAKGLERARKAQIPTFIVDYGTIIKEYKKDPENAKLPEDFDYHDILSRQSLLGGEEERVKAFLETRAMAESSLLREMGDSFDLLVLAGFMRNLTPYFIDRVNIDPKKPRIMNIHPALLPSFPGVDGYGDTLLYGCKVGGCTVHFIDYGEDSGPIIGQRAFPIVEGDTRESVIKKGLKLEWELYPECIKLFAQGRLKTVVNTYPGGGGTGRKRTVVSIKGEN